MIEIRNLTVAFDRNVIFENRSFSFPDEGTVLLTGESGIGKTTLLRVIAGLIKLQSGVVYGTENRKISFAFQEPRLLPHLTALQNVSLVSNTDTAKKLLSELNLTDVSDQKASDLSGGQKQRVSLARAYAFSRDIVLLDEPFTGLDASNKERAAELIRTSRLAIVVSHDPSDELLLHCTRKINL